MNIYSVVGCFYDKKEMDDVYSFGYLVHDKEFTKSEFEKMCKKGLESILDKNIFELEDFLKLNYGFKILPITQKFEFEEEE